MGSDDTERLGWTTIADATVFLETLYPSGPTWEAAPETDKRALLLTAYGDIKNNPNYDIPAFGSGGWNSLDPSRALIVQQAQAAQAAFSLLNPGAARNADIRAQGIKQFTASRFSQTFADGAAREAAELYMATPLSQRVKDMLFSFLVSEEMSVRGRIVRRYTIP